MEIAIIGAGYVGLCTGAGLASLGHQVTLVEIDKEKVDKINSGIPTIFEEGLDKLMAELVPARMKATDNLEEAVKQSRLIFICVGTPSKDDGRIDVSQVERAGRQIGEAMKKGEIGIGREEYRVIVVKSTVIPGTTERVAGTIERESGKRAGRDFGVCVNPELLREGKALEDFFNPDRIVIGQMDERAGNILEEVYREFQAPRLKTGLRTAEMIKYASNSLLAAKVSFSNEIGNICKRLGVDVYEVMKGVGMDGRISPKFLEAGIGFGGSCFLKDMAALKGLAEDLGEETRILKAVMEVNKKQRVRMVEMLHKLVGGLKGRKIAVLGLAFKPGTDDVREAPSIEIVKGLVDRGASVRAYDPKAMKNFRKLYPGIEYAENIKDCLDGADAALILTEWEEFKGLEQRNFGNITVLEGRKVLDKEKARFEGICW